MTIAGDGCECKVGRAIDEYDLTGLDEELAARRRGESGSPASLRDLVDHFNRAVLEGAIAAAGGNSLDGEVENLYRLLTDDDDVSSAARVRARKRLERDGVDIDAVERRFVSHPTIGNHLADCLGVEKATTTGPGVETARERIFKIRNRTEAVVETTLDGLSSADHVAASDLTVTVDVGITCEDCGVHRGVGAFVDRGGCDCDRE